MKKIKLYKTGLYNEGITLSDTEFEWELAWDDIINNFVEVSSYDWAEITHFLGKFRILQLWEEKTIEKIIWKKIEDIENYIEIDKETYEEISLENWIDENDEIIDYANEMFKKGYTHYAEIEDNDDNTHIIEIIGDKNDLREIEKMYWKGEITKEDIYYWTKKLKNMQYVVEDWSEKLFLLKKYFYTDYDI